MSEDQMELMRDKFVLWERASRQGPMDLRDYNHRCAEAIKALLAEHSACSCGAARQDAAPDDATRPQGAEGQ